jgi:hypothetical protein
MWAPAEGAQKRGDGGSRQETGRECMSRSSCCYIRWRWGALDAIVSVSSEERKKAREAICDATARSAIATCSHGACKHGAFPTLPLGLGFADSTRR